MTIRSLALTILMFVASAVPFAADAGRPASAPAAGQATAQEAPTRRPDVIYVPTPKPVVEAMLQVANVTKNDIVYDLGCGDGRIPVTAAKKYGAPRRRASTSIRSASRKRTRTSQKNNVGDLVKIVQGDLFSRISARPRWSRCICCRRSTSS